jgi:hypothetical protein
MAEGEKLSTSIATAVLVVALVAFATAIAMQSRARLEEDTSREPAVRAQNPAPIEEEKEETGSDSQQRYAKKTPSQAESKAGWWQKFITDPNATFAGAVTAFTLALVVVGAYQARRLRQAVDAMRASERRDLRAYVVVNGGTIINVTGTPQPPTPGQPVQPAAALVNPAIGPVAQLTLLNAGKTPARLVVCSAGIEFREFPLSSPPALAEVASPARSVLGPGVASTATRRMPQQLTPQQVIDLLAGTGAVYVYGIITYEDVYRESHTTSFRLMYHILTGVIPFTSELTFCAEGNDFD